MAGRLFVVRFCCACAGRTVAVVAAAAAGKRTGRTEYPKKDTMQSLSYYSFWIESVCRGGRGEEESPNHLVWCDSTTHRERASERASDASLQLLIYGCADLVSKKTRYQSLRGSNPNPSETLKTSFLPYYLFYFDFIIFLLFPLFEYGLNLSGIE